MAVNKLPDGRWRVDVEPVKGRRFRKIFATKGEALRYEASIKAEVYQPDWEPRKTDKRKLSELVQLWYELHGVTLADSARRLSRLLAIVKGLGDPVAEKLKPSAFARWRSDRLQAGITARTCNNDLTFIRAMYNQLKASGVVEYENPLKTLEPVKFQEKAFAYLEADQILELLHLAGLSGNVHLSMLIRICLSTGCRWSEAENLKPCHVQAGALVFEGTKNRRVRSVPVSDSLIQSLRKHWATCGPFTGSLTSFRRCLAKCSFTLPRGQASHILRHTFASVFVQRGGNLLVLQRILGHSSITVTMRYSHLAPDHLQDALALNPLCDFDTSSTQKQQA